jgi:lycopene cyclase domain-containing protein
MSYSLFLIFFVMLPVSGMLFALRRSLRRRHILLLFILAVVALLYSTPWENYLVASGVSYFDPKVVTNILGYVPLEEYLFLIMQAFLTGLIVLWLWRRYHRAEFNHRSGIDQDNG